MKADLIIHNIGQLVTCSSPEGSRRRRAMKDLGLVSGAAVAVNEGSFIGIGSTADILREFQADQVIDAAGRAACPGLVDPHTHIVYAGDRLDEFEQKLNGADYLEILAAGGGILSTVRRTRDATSSGLVETASRRLSKMAACGTTTCEIKTGYGLDLATEMKMLGAIDELARSQPVNIVPTFLPAHTIPGEYKANPDGYTDLVCDEMLPHAWEWFTSSTFLDRTPFFCDVFCENGSFTVDQSRKILERASRLGFGIKAHVDQFTSLGGSRMAIEAGATSIDHLDKITSDEIDLLAGSDTVGVVIPTESFNGGKCQFADARSLIDRGCVVALSTDYNPGSAPCPSQMMTMAIACRYQHLSPAEVFNAVTINAARAVGLSHKIGSIEVGKSADLLILDTSDYREAAYEFGGNLVSAVFKAGLAIC